MFPALTPISSFLLPKHSALSSTIALTPYYELLAVFIFNFDILGFSTITDLTRAFWLESSLNQISHFAAYMDPILSSFSVNSCSFFSVVSVYGLTSENEVSI